jgi:hypothetical protein
MWCLWLLGSWALTIGLDAPASAVRLMIFASMTGIMVLWPVWRLSQGSDRIGPGIIFRDWLSLNLVFQAVVWPLKVSADWDLAQTLWLDTAVAGWTLLTALLVAVGCRSSHGAIRTVAMALCLLLVLGEPLIMALINLSTSVGDFVGPTWCMRISPIQALWVLAGPSLSFTDIPWSSTVISIGLVATIGWLITAWIMRRQDESLRR